MKLFKAFTLAEIIVVIALLGTIAALTVPSAIKNTTQKANVTKIKKAMMVYDKAISQYYLTDYNNYRAQYNAIPFDPNNELNNYTEGSDEYKDVSKRLKNELTNKRNEVKRKNTETFANYFNAAKKEVAADGTINIMTKDRLWWQFDNSGNFLKTMVAFKKDYLKPEIADNPEDNRAFYFIARMTAYTTTPITNPVEFSIQDYLSSQVASTTNNYTDTNRMIKLYSYIGKFIVPITKTKETECRNVKQQCASIQKYNFWKNQYPELGNGAEVKLYEDGHQTLFQLYDPNTKELMIEADINEYNKGFQYSDKFKINKNGKTSCYTLEPTERFLKQHPDSTTPEFRANHKGCSSGHVYAIWTYLGINLDNGSNCTVTEVTCN